MVKTRHSPSSLRGAFALALPAFLFATLSAHAIELGQVDDFQNATTMSWQHGAQSSHAPRVVLDAGPEGAGDHALAVSSSGSGLVGSRIIMFNRNQWTGDFLSAEVTAISFHLRHVSGANASVRVSLRGPGGDFSTTTAIQVPSGTGWAHYTIDITPDNLTRVSGSGTAEQTLGGVSEMRLLSATNPSWIGDQVAMELHYDNIRAEGEGEEETPFEAWRAENFFDDDLMDEAISGPLADPDGDSVANLLEFVLLGDPNIPSTANIPRVSVSTDPENAGNETFLAIEFTRREDLGEVVLEVQTADEIGAWSPNAVLVDSTANGNGSVTELWRDNVSATTPNTRFIRLVARQE